MLLFFCRGYFVGGESNRGGYSVGGESNRITRLANGLLCIGEPGQCDVTEKPLKPSFLFLKTFRWQKQMNARNAANFGALCLVLVFVFFVVVVSCARTFRCVSLSHT